MEDRQDDIVWYYMDDLMPLIRGLGYTNPNDALRDLYVNREWSMREIANAFDKHISAIWSKLDKLGIPRRGRGGHHGGVNNGI